MSVWFVKLENVEKCECFSKPGDDVLTCLVLSVTQIYSVYLHGGVKKPKIFIYLKL